MEKRLAGSTLKQPLRISWNYFGVEEVINWVRFSLDIYWQRDF
jgi:hypothetical protein